MSELNSTYRFHKSNFLSSALYSVHATSNQGSRKQLPTKQACVLRIRMYRTTATILPVLQRVWEVGCASKRVRVDPAPTGSATANQRADPAHTGCPTANQKADPAHTVSPSANQKAGSTGSIVTPLQAHYVCKLTQPPILPVQPFRPSVQLSRKVRPVLIGCRHSRATARRGEQGVIHTISPHGPLTFLEVCTIHHATPVSLLYFFSLSCLFLLPDRKHSRATAAFVLPPLFYEQGMQKKGFQV